MEGPPSEYLKDEFKVKNSQIGERTSQVEDKELE
jgi:hypothetical protein